MAPVREGAGVVFGPLLAREFGHERVGNEIAELAHDGELGGAWMVVCFFFIPAVWQGQTQSSDLVFTRLWDDWGARNASPGRAD